jgi:hypothetical protein
MGKRPLVLCLRSGPIGGMAGRYRDMPYAFVFRLHRHQKPQEKRSNINKKAIMKLQLGNPDLNSSAPDSP